MGYCCGGLSLLVKCKNNPKSIIMPPIIPMITPVKHNPIPNATLIGGVM